MLAKIKKAGLRKHHLAYTKSNQYKINSSLRAFYFRKFVKHYLFLKKSFVRRAHVQSIVAEVHMVLRPQLPSPR